MITPHFEEIYLHRNVSLEYKTRTVKLCKCIYYLEDLNPRGTTNLYTTSKLCYILKWLGW